MPRKKKVMPDDRSEWTFGDLLYWHFFIHGTRPEAPSPFGVGRIWGPQQAAAELGITPRTLWNWVDDRHPPYDTVAIERVLFGNNAQYDGARTELRMLLITARRPKPGAEPAPGRGVVPVVTGQAVTVYETPFEDADVDGPPDSEARGPGTAVAVAEKFGNLAKNILEKGFTGWSLPVWLGGDDPANPARAKRRRIIAGVLAVLTLIGAFEFGKHAGIVPTSAPAAPPFAEAPKGPTTAELQEAQRRAEAAEAALKKANEEARAREAAAETERDRKAREAEAQRKAAADRAARGRAAPELATGDQAARNRAAQEQAARDKAAREAAEQRAREREQATLDSIAQKKAEEEAKATEVNRKLRAMESAEVDVCKKQLEGISVPGFSLRCNTLIPFGKLLRGVGVSQTASSLSDCAARCRRAPDCVAFSFDAGAHTGAASCYLTGSITRYSAATNWISGTR